MQDLVCTRSKTDDEINIVILDKIFISHIKWPGKVILTPPLVCTFILTGKAA